MAKQILNKKSQKKTQFRNVKNIPKLKKAIANSEEESLAGCAE